jgi:hypothetical protein
VSGWPLGASATERYGTKIRFAANETQNSTPNVILLSLLQQRGASLLRTAAVSLTKFGRSPSIDCMAVIYWGFDHGKLQRDPTLSL